jgi:hypothetical protein
MITGTSLIAWRLKPECSPWYPSVGNCLDTYTCSGQNTYSSPASGPTLTLRNNTYGYNECIFQLDWYAARFIGGGGVCRIFAQAIKNPYPFLTYLPTQGMFYDSTAVFPCTRPISVTFSSIYFDEFNANSCFGCSPLDGMRPFTVTITE